jgi:hypothetical protein
MRYTFPFVIVTPDTLSRLNSLPALLGLAEEIASNNPDSKLFFNASIRDDVLLPVRPTA